MNITQQEPSFAELVEAALCLWSVFCDTETLYPEIMAIEEGYGLAFTRELFTNIEILSALKAGWNLADNFTNPFDTHFIPEFLSYCVAVKNNSLALRENWKAICKNMTTSPESLSWNADDSYAAQEQGWDIFSTSRSPTDQLRAKNGAPYGYRPYEIQKLDEADIFSSDEEVMLFIMQNAQNNNLLAAKAVEFIRRKSPVEYRTILTLVEERTKRNEDAA